MLHAALLVLALSAVPATELGTQPGPRDEAAPTRADQQAAKQRPEASASCAVQATACEDRCKDEPAGEELSCKARCKRDELACSTGSKHEHPAGRTPAPATPQRRRSRARVHTPPSQIPPDATAPWP